jgi:hypothetical protein
MSLNGLERDSHWDRAASHPVLAVRVHLDRTDRLGGGVEVELKAHGAATKVVPPEDVKRGKDRNKVSPFRLWAARRSPGSSPSPSRPRPHPTTPRHGRPKTTTASTLLAQLDFSPAPVPVCTLHERHPELIHIKRCGVVGCPDE